MEAFSVIIGENNIGKTTMIEALENIISPNKYFRYFPIDQKDFCDISYPIEIEITFKDPDSLLISSLQDGIIDPDTNEFILKFVSIWELENQDVKNDCYFIKKSNIDAKPSFSKQYRDLIQFYLIPSERYVKRSISSRKGSDMSKISTNYLQAYNLSLASLKKHLIGKLQNLKNKIRDELEISSLISKLDEIEVLLNSDITQDSFEAVYQNLANFDRVLNISNYEIQENLLKILSEDTENIKKMVKTYEKKAEIQVKLKDLESLLAETQEFKTLETEISNIFDILIPMNKFDFSYVSFSDEELFKTPLFEIDDFNILEHGMGFQSSFVISLKLARILSILNQKSQKSAFICIEEPGVYIYPHLQRQLIQNLKKLREKYKNDLNIQFIITSHSSDIISQIQSQELIILKKKQSYTNAIYLPNKRTYTKNTSSLGSKKKLYKKLFMVENNLFRFYPEAFFSRAIILGEGESEEGALPIWSQKLDNNLDNYGITYVLMRGDGNIDYYESYFDGIGIPYVAILDKDKDRTPNNSHELITNETNFEAEIMKCYPYYKILQVIEKLSGKLELERFYNDLRGIMPLPSDVLDFGDIIRFFELNKSNQSIRDPIKLRIKIWMSKKKGLMFGHLIAEIAESNEIPEIYKELIKKAISLI